MSGQVLVTGVTGTVGRLVAKGLVEKGEAVVGATRDPAGAGANSAYGIKYAAFDLDRPETFAPALAGVDRVFLIARPGDDEPQRTAIPLIDEMKRQGVRHVANLSAMGVDSRNDIGLRQVERCLEDSGIGYTHLRPNWFMQILAGGPLLADIRATGALHIPAWDARISYIDARDIAAVAAAALRDECYVNKAYTLTGSEALDHHAVTDAISEAAGKTITYVPIGEDEARTAIQAAGLSQERADRLIGFYRLVRAGFCATVSCDVERVLGRPAIGFRAFVRDYAICWR